MLAIDYLFNVNSHYYYFFAAIGTEHLYVESMAVEHNFGLPLSRLDYDTIVPQNGFGNDGGDKRNSAGVISSDSPYRNNYFRRLPNGESGEKNKMWICFAQYIFVS